MKLLFGICVIKKIVQSFWSIDEVFSIDQTQPKGEVCVKILFGICESV